ncbi:PREDICTED: zinc finger protein 862-like [Priapulus caudatus]|uniref:Zinc finger protein 862-like n=1 Tax=Priapulus caudatus TaxID=37621 RepID=A0ABM1E3J1_PRICU|nr:PREDICTED: zinc finger protein 862-like [Priapulus caudatus]
MTKFGCPDWLDKVIGVGCDGAAVNIGNKNSVKTRLLQECPHLVVTHCVAHRLELGVLNAIKENEMLTTVKDMLLKVHKHYHYSPKALRELRAIANAMDERCIKPKRLQGTRWLPHIMKASKALMDGYVPVRAHFEHVSQAGPNQATAEVKGRATYLANKLKDYRVLRFMVFLEDLLEIVSALSLKFQSSCLTSVDYLDALETANLMLVQLRQQPGDHYNAFTANIVQSGDGDWEYKGHKLLHYQPHAYNFDNTIDAVMERMNGRLQNQDPILSQARVFDCKDWPRDRQELAVYGNEQVAALTRHFSTVLTKRQCDIAAIANEWTQVKAHLGRRMANNPRVLPSISVIFPLGEMCSNLLHLVEIILTIPVSTAVCERGFSAVKRIKSDWRASLTTETMTRLLGVSMEGPTLDAYDAGKAMDLWWTRAQRSRRPQFHDADDDDDDDDNDLW